ncbi:pyridoxal phosphate-dependent transferase [Chloropicon primus]|uniref:Pyridoxal phosphate-dependent transferase n=2 Tax=Chloropicon primus TaxID=1764295 RepID=A0A5B8MCH6_9CHLO|nr:pyridoxal phosphate-dependent transferase [Chloropicon primus]UPQ97047.1 pyridoxal phosphate-dependent transferase [Chloropicon primus]|eukprot:QDZ17831.1 pyridoxal phosphate-dependent transferase [Chloropicon primus]
MSRTPLASGVAERGMRREIPFHMPGHQRGRIVHPVMRELAKDVLRFDTTEVKGLDYLSTPSGIIQEAQSLASEAFGADRSWFLVNGTTVGIHAAVMSVVRGEGDSIVLSRDCHQSAFSALVLSGAVPVWAKPDYNEGFGFATASAGGVREALEGCDEPPAGVLLVSPNYYGVCADVSEVARACHHGQQVPLLVDEAHGSHFAFHERFPPSSLESGADLVVQSTHKTLGAMTQASMLHVKGERVSSDSICTSLQVLQSSSPSYILMSSLDAARAQASMASDYCDGEPGSEQKFSRVVEDSLGAKEEINRIPGLQVLGGRGVDPLRLTVCVAQLGHNGFDVSSILEERHGIVPELANEKCVVFILTLSTTLQDLEQLTRALRDVASSSRRAQSGRDACSSEDSSGLASVFDSPQVLSPREAFFSNQRRVDIGNAVGQISAETVCPYPPGIPILCPGERITRDALEFLQTFKSSGGYVTGCSDATLSSILIVVNR